MAEVPVLFPLSGRRVFVAGHNGMVGSALVRRLSRERCEVLVAERSAVDLRRQAATEKWMKMARPDVVVIAAARVAGILDNDTHPVAFLHDNLLIEANVIHAAHVAGVKKLLFLGSSCIYPRLAAQPITEDSLMTGPLEPTNEWYAVAKIIGIRLCQAYRRQYGRDFISVMPTNLYGLGDNYDLMASHVLPALIRKAHEAKTTGASHLTVWGTGKPRREFLFSEDLADALVFLLERYSDESQINVGTGVELTIKDLAKSVCQIVGFTGRLEFDTSKPDGAPAKLLDTTRLSNLGWRPQTALTDGIRKTYESYLRHPTARARRSG